MNAFAMACFAKGGMPKSTYQELTDRNLLEFVYLQNSMLLAKKENAKETYASLKDRYTYLKASLIASGVNLDEIDKIKE